MMRQPMDTAIREHPNQLAYVDQEVSLTYRELPNAIRDLDLPGLENVRPGQHVAWSPRNNADAFLTFWALQWRRHVACPISFRIPPEQRQALLARINAHWLPDLHEKGSAPNVTRSIEPPMGPDVPATLLLSSGSTGVPKAIVHAMSAHVANALGSANNIFLEPGDRWLWSLPLFHISGLSILIRCAVAGATVVGMAEGAGLTTPVLHENQVTHLSVVSTQLRRLLGDKRFPAGELKSVLLGGGSVDPDLVTEARTRGVQVHTTYGLTEAASQVTSSTHDAAPTTSGRVLDGREVKISPRGEVLIRGNTLCLGYFRDGEIQSVVDEEGWFHTKDLGHFDEDGQLTIDGRMDNMFISGGENIHPESIERAMMAAFGIGRVVVVPEADESFGERPVAFVLGQLPADWETVLRSKLKGFEIPRRILAWPAEDGAMKIDRQKFKRLVNERQS